MSGINLGSKTKLIFRNTRFSFYIIRVKYDKNKLTFSCLSHGCHYCMLMRLSNTANWDIPNNPAGWLKIRYRGKVCSTAVDRKFVDVAFSSARS